jgi:hypothetical protein
MRAATQLFLLSGLFLSAFANAAQAGTLTASLIRADTSAPITVPAGKTLPINCNGSDQLSYQFDIAAGASSGSITIPNGVTAECSLNSEDTGWLLVDRNVSPAPGTVTVTMPSNGASASLNFSFKPTTGVITINLINKRTGAPIAVPGTNNETAECTSLSGNGTFRVEFQAGASSIQVPVFRKAVYSCRINNLNGYYNEFSQGVTVPSVGAANTNFKLEPLEHTVTLQFVDQSGNPFTPPAVEDYASFSCSVINDEESYYTNEGFEFDGSRSSVTLGVVTGKTYTCDGFEVSPYHSDPITFTVPDGQNLTVPLTLVQRTVQATFNLERDGAAFPVPDDTFPRIRCEGEQTGAHYGSETLQPGNTGGVVNLFADVQYVCFLQNFDGYFALAPIRFTATAESAPTFTFLVDQMEATIAIQLKTPNGSVFETPDEVSVGCSYESTDQSDFQSQYHSGTIAVGTSSASLLVTGGSQMRCSLGSPEGYSVSASVTKNVPVSGTTTFDFTVYPKDATVNFELVNEQGAPLSELVACTAYVNQIDSRLQDGMINESIPNGQASVQVPSGVAFYTYASCDSGNSSFATGDNGALYFQPSEDSSNPFTLSPGETRTVKVVFQQPNAFANVTVKDDTGTALASVDVYTDSERIPSRGSYSVYGQTDADGVARIPLISGVKWTLRAGSGSDPSRDVETLGSAPYFLTPAAGAEEDVTLVVKRVLTRINITTTTSVVPQGNGYCFAYDDAGVISYSPEQPPLTYVKQISLSEGSWKVACIGWGEKPGTGAVGLYSEVTPLEIGPDTNEQSITINLLEGNSITSVLSPFTPSQGSSVSANGIQVEVPPNSITGESGQVSLSNNPSDTAATFDVDFGRPANAFSISLRNSQGGAVSRFGAISLTLSHDVSAGQTVTIRRFLGGTRGWTEVTSDTPTPAGAKNRSKSVSPSSTNGSATVQVTEGGVYGIFVKDGPPSGTPTPAPLDKVKGLKASFAKGVAKLSWKPVTSAAQYTVQVHRFTKGKKTKLIRSRVLDKTKINIKGLARGKYRFTVWGINGATRGAASSVTRAH